MTQSVHMAELEFTLTGGMRKIFFLKSDLKSPNNIKEHC